LEKRPNQGGSSPSLSYGRTVCAWGKEIRPKIKVLWGVETEKRLQKNRKKGRRPEGAKEGDKLDLSEPKSQYFFMVSVSQLDGRGGCYGAGGSASNIGRGGRGSLSGGLGSLHQK